MKLEVNGKLIKIESDPTTPLLWVLREELGYTGTKFGCGMAQCGACTIHLDGVPVRACVTPVSAATSKKVTTIEALAGPEITALRKAWVELEVAQCGYCQSGQLMTASHLLSQKKNPSDLDIDEAMNGNLCRCATYNRIKDGIKLAASHLGAAK